MVVQPYSNLSKYQIIKQIMTKINIRCNDTLKGYFLDDTDSWGLDKRECPSVKFIQIPKP